jgi:hypothetical protein
MEGADVDVDVDGRKDNLLSWNYRFAARNGTKTVLLFLK